jgi:hypothetical protein
VQRARLWILLERRAQLLVPPLLRHATTCVSTQLAWRVAWRVACRSWCTHLVLGFPGRSRRHHDREALQDTSAHDRSGRRCGGTQPARRGAQRRKRAQPLDRRRLHPT